MPRLKRVPVARHARAVPGRDWKRVLTAVGVSLLVLAVSAGACRGHHGLAANESFSEEAFAAPEGVAAAPDIGALEGSFDLLLVGSDLCEPEYAPQFGKRCEEDDGGERNDVTMLVHVSEAPRRATIISFPRDMIVPIPACPSEDGTGEYSEMAAQPLNATMSYGGMPCTWLTIQELTGIPIQFAAKITWGGVIEMSNAIGGVEVVSVVRASTTLILGYPSHRGRTRCRVRRHSLSSVFVTESAMAPTWEGSAINNNS